MDEMGDLSELKRFRVLAGLCAAALYIFLVVTGNVWGAEPLGLEAHELSCTSQKISTAEPDVLVFLFCRGIVIVASLQTARRTVARYTFSCSWCARFGSWSASARSARWSLFCRWRSKPPTIVANPSCVWLLMQRARRVVGLALTLVAALHTARRTVEHYPCSCSWCMRFGASPEYHGVEQAFRPAVRARYQRLQPL